MNRMYYLQWQSYKKAKYIHTHMLERQPPGGVRYAMDWMGYLTMVEYQKPSYIKTHLFTKTATPSGPALDWKV